MINVGQSGKKGFIEGLNPELPSGGKCGWVWEIHFHYSWCLMPHLSIQVPCLTHICLTVVRAAFWKRSGLNGDHGGLRHQLGYVWRWWKALLPGTTFPLLAQINLHQNTFAQHASLMGSPKYTKI